MRVAVIGGGIGGLASAHCLSNAGVAVTLFEASDQLGGLGTFFRYGGRFYERFYHVVMPSDEHLLALLEALDLHDRTYWREGALGIIYGRRLHGLKGPADLLRFPPLTITDRLRLGLTALYATHVAKPGPLDTVTAAEWLTRLSGRRVFETIWRPLLEAKFGDAYRQIPALWYWAKFKREKGTRTEIKGYVRGGYKAITDKLADSLRARGVVLKLNAPIEHLSLTSDGRPTLRVQGETLTFDRAVSTLPPVLLRRIVEGGRIVPYLGGWQSDIDYQGVVNVAVFLRRSLSEYYWVPVVDSGMPFQGIVESTRVIDLDDSGGLHLCYLLNYVYRSHPLFSRDADEIRDTYVDSLLELYPDLKRRDIVDAFTFRAPFVEPIYTPGYLSRKPTAQLVPDAVYLATTAQVYPNVTSWNSATLLADQVVAELIAASKAST